MKSPAALFHLSSISVVEIMRKDAQKIHHLPNIIARHVNDLIELHNDWESNRDWERIKNKFTPSRLLYFIHAFKYSAKCMAILMGMNGNLELVQLCCQLDNSINIDGIIGNIPCMEINQEWVGPDQAYKLRSQSENRLLCQYFLK